MTVANTNVSSSYNCNGVTREFNIGFHYNSTLSGLSIVVLHADGTSTTVTANYEIEDNVLTYPTLESELDPLPEGDVITISRVTPLTQSINLVQQGPLDAEVLEGGYDKATLQIQEVSSQKQDKLIAGENIVIDEDGTISATGEVVEGVNWGNIHGTLSNQTDLQSALATKQDTLVSGTNIKTVNGSSLLGSGNVDIDALPSQTGNAGKFLSTNGTVASWADLSTRNIGEIVQSTIPLTDAWLHLLDGSLISSGSYSDFVDYISGLVSTYPDLFTTEAAWQTAVTTYGVCGKFVYDGVNSTVRLPKITGFIEGTTDQTALGDLVEAGLPNITGYGKWIHETGTGTGAIYSETGNINQNATSNGGEAFNKVYFDASRSDSTYGNSSTVQPQAIKTLYYIVIATAVKTDIQVDIDEIATDLNGKADVDLTNVNNSGTSTGAGWAMPSDTYEALTLGASGASYTAPANGWVILHGSQTSINGYVFLRNITAGELCNYQQHSQVNNFEIRVFIPVEKNQTFIVDYSGVSASVFRFIYAEGSKSEAN